MCATYGLSMATSAHRQVTRSAPFQVVVRLGLVAYGVVHILVAWLAVQVAVGDLDGDGVGKADKTGALQSLSANAAGDVLLWLIAVGLGVSALWQLLEAATGNRTGMRLMNLGEAVLFGYLAFSAGKLAAGSPASSTDQAQLGLVGTLLAQPWGKPVVIALGVLIVLAGLFVVRHGLTRRFEEEHDLAPAGRPVRTAVLRLGQVGYAALGGVYAIAGVLVVVAAVRSQPAKATGLDVALKTLAAQPHGTVILLVIALGLAAFAVFTFFAARYRRVT
jgi:energy-converting hydrogenase Eha subunit C